MISSLLSSSCFRVFSTWNTQKQMSGCVFFRYEFTHACDSISPLFLSLSSNVMRRSWFACAHALLGVLGCVGTGFRPGFCVMEWYHLVERHFGAAKSFFPSAIISFGVPRVCVGNLHGDYLPDVGIETIRSI